MTEQIMEIFKADGTSVEAKVFDNMRPEDLLLVDQTWRPYRIKLFSKLLEGGVERNEWPQSLHWDWSKKANDLELLEVSG